MGGEAVRLAVYNIKMIPYNTHPRLELAAREFYRIYRAIY